ncbi:MAG TPA: Uma2 family endonuclease [Mycobacteriales bacterium]|nr:Uma2 family endonuclease [Mycobacteriales bacterium]
MTTIVRGPRPPELEQLLERRRRSGADRFDEVWEGRYVVAPDPHAHHGTVMGELYALLKPAAGRLGLRALLTFNLGGPGDYRIPDAGLTSAPAGVWHDSAVLVVEVLSPDDMTFEKLDFYTARGVQELLVVDWRDRSVRCFALQEGQAERDRSEVLAMTTAEVVAAVDWPPEDDGA